MSFRNQTRRWNRQMLSWISPKQLALLLLGTAILSFGMIISTGGWVLPREAFWAWCCCWITSFRFPHG